VILWSEPPRHDGKSRDDASRRHRKRRGAERLAASYGYHYHAMHRLLIRDRERRMSLEAEKCEHPGRLSL
jgi:hypothetical protein